MLPVRQPLSRWLVVTALRTRSRIRINFRRWWSIRTLRPNRPAKFAEIGIAAAAGPVRPAASATASAARAARRGGGYGRQGARAHQPHRQLDQRDQRRDARDQQSRIAGRRVANRSRPRHQRKRWTGFDDERPAARRQYRPDPGDDRRHPDQRSDRRERRFRFRDVRAERHRADRGAERPAKRALWLGRDGRRRQHHHQEGLRSGAIQRPHRSRKLWHRGRPTDR